MKTQVRRFRWREIDDKTLTLQALLFGNIWMVVESFVSQAHRSGEAIIAYTFGHGTADGAALSAFGSAALTVLVTKSAPILNLFQRLFVSRFHKILLVPLDKVCRRSIFRRATQHMFRFVFSLPNSNMFDLKVSRNIGTEALWKATGTIQVATFVTIAITPLWAGQWESPCCCNCCIH